MDVAEKQTKKKLLYFVPEFPRLTETFIEREISKLIEFDNLDIVVFSLAKASGAMSENVKDKVVYQKLTWRASFLAGFYFFTRTRAVLDAWKLVWDDKTKSVIKRAYLFLKGVGYTKLFERYNPEHIHVNFLSDPSTIALIVSKILNIPFSISAHAKDVFVDGTLISEKAREAKFITVCNENTWRKVVEEANKERASGKVRLIFHGIEAQKVFIGTPDIKKPDRPMIFLGGTRLVEKKGIKYMVEASRILKDRGIEHQVDIVGPGPLYEELMVQIKELGLEDTVIIHGEGKGTPFKLVAQYYQIADIFVLPSIVTQEGDVDGVPTVVIEAALAHLPMVTTSAGSITDLVTADAGILIPDKDAVAIADAVEKLLSDKDLAKRLGDTAHKKASEMFNLERNVGELESLLLN